MNNRAYFKRLNYHKEDIATQPFHGMSVDIDGISDVDFMSIDEYINTIAPPMRDVSQIFDYSKTDRQKHCGLGDLYSDEAFEKKNSGFYMRIGKDVDSSKSIFVKYSADDKNTVLYDVNYIEVEAGANAKLVIYYESDASKEEFRNGLFSIKLGDGAELELIKVQDFSYESKNFESMRVDLGEKSKFIYYPIELGSKINATANMIYMPKDWAEVEVNPLYFVDNERRMDLDQNVVIDGKNCEGLINAKGAMKDKGFKMFRGNVFLNRGCSRSIGRFADSNIILSPTARAMTIPTIFCDEDDVVGEHAASFECINKSKLYYLKTRGLNEMEAKKLIVSASFNPIFAKIQNEEIREKLIDNLADKLMSI